MRWSSSQQHNHHAASFHFNVNGKGSVFPCSLGQSVRTTCTLDQRLWSCTARCCLESVCGALGGKATTSSHRAHQCRDAVGFGVFAQRRPALKTHMMCLLTELILSLLPRQNTVQITWEINARSCIEESFLQFVCETLEDSCRDVVGGASCDVTETAVERD